MKPKVYLCELFAGGGTLGRALQDGLSTHCEIAGTSASEIDPRYLDNWSENHPKGHTFGGNLTQFHPSELSNPTDAIRILAAGIPCTGASKAGRSKNKIARAEDHQKAGILFLPTLHYIRLHHPEIVVIENVPEYGNSLSGDILREALTTSGYHHFETTVNAYTQFDTPTARKRWVLVATKTPFQWNFCAKPFQGTLAPYLDPELNDDEVFSPEAVQKHKAYIDRKTSEGCGFKHVVLDKTSPSAPTFVRTYHKLHYSGPFLKSGDTYRQFRPREIARLSGIPDDFRLPEAKTTAIEILGQGVCYKPFLALGEALGTWIAQKMPASTPTPKPQQLELLAA
jgi:DNA (cytosine-5)-methyltransferase 1